MRRDSLTEVVQMDGKNANGSISLTIILSLFNQPHVIPNLDTMKVNED